MFQDVLGYNEQEKTLVLKLGDTLELFEELENIKGTGFHLQRPYFNRMQPGN